MPERVTLRVYDLSQGMAAAMSQQLLGQRLDIVPHTGVFVYGKEWFFSGSMGGIQAMPTWGVMPIHETIELGATEVPEELFAAFIDEIRERYTGETYNLLRNNCNHFSSAATEFLIGQQIPDRILGLPERVLATPLGQALAPMLDQMGRRMDPLGAAGGAPPRCVWGKWGGEKISVYFKSPNQNVSNTTISPPPPHPHHHISFSLSLPSSTSSQSQSLLPKHLHSYNLA